MKLCVFSYNVPPGNDLFIPTIETVRRYCSRYNLAFVLNTESKVNWKHYFCERFFVGELLKDYDRVLYMDADIVVKPDAPNLFDIVPYEMVAAFDENFGEGQMDRQPMITPLLGLCPDWPKNERGLYRFFNAGVMMYSKCHSHLFENFREKAPTEEAMWVHWPDQTYLNYLVASNRVPFYSLPSQFNKMSMAVMSSREERFKAHFIHYAGGTEFYEKAKYDVMQEDIGILYPS